VTHNRAKMNPLKVLGIFLLGVVCGWALDAFVGFNQSEQRYSMQVIQPSLVYRIDSRSGKIEVFAFNASDGEIKVRTMADAVQP